MALNASLGRSSLKSGPTRTTTRSVSFHSEDESFPIIHIDDMDDEEVVATWFTSLECSQLRKDAHESAAAIDDGETDVEKRGLEARTKTGAYAAYKSRQGALDVVLGEQEKAQRRRKKVDWETVSQLYTIHSLLAQEPAQKRAQFDAMEAQAWLQSHPLPVSKEGMLEGSSLSSLSKVNELVDVPPVVNLSPLRRSMPIHKKRTSDERSTDSTVDLFQEGDFDDDDSDSSGSVVSESDTEPSDSDDEFGETDAADSAQEVPVVVRRAPAKKKFDVDEFIQKFSTVRSYNRNRADRPKVKTTPTEDTEDDDVSISLDSVQKAFDQRKSGKSSSSFGGSSDFAASSRTLNTSFCNHLIKKVPARSKSTKIREAIKTLSKQGNDDDELRHSRHNAQRRRISASNRLSIVLFQD